MELIEKSILPCSLKASTKLQQKSMFYGSVIKPQIKHVIFNIKIYSFYAKNSHIYSYSQNVCLQMSSTFPKLPLLGTPKVTINMNNKIQTPIVQWPIPIHNAL
jgi:hypothetical protein